MRKSLKIFLCLLLVVLVIIQFFPAEENSSPAYSGHRLTDSYKVPQEVQEILAVSCYDCHSNNTRPMFYMRMQLVGWWIKHHIDEGKDELNFDEFGAYPLYRQYHKLEEIIEQVEKDEMPLTSYTLIHTDATLTDAEKKSLTGWAGALMDTLAAHYPPDSLVRRK